MHSSALSQQPAPVQDQAPQPCLPPECAQKSSVMFSPFHTAVTARAGITQAKRKERSGDGKEGRAALPWSGALFLPGSAAAPGAAGSGERQRPPRARHRRVRAGAQGRDTELIVSALLHNTVALTLCHVKILNCLFISHPLFILIVPDKQGHFTFVFSVRAYRAYLCRPRDFQSLPVALVDAEE